MASQEPPATLYHSPGQITGLQSAPATWEERGHMRKPGWSRKKTSLSLQTSEEGIRALTEWP